MRIYFNIIFYLHQTEYYQTIARKHLLLQKNSTAQNGSTVAHMQQPMQNHVPMPIPQFHGKFSPLRSLFYGSSFLTTEI